MYNEKNISTKPDKKKAETRISCQDENKKRTQDSGPQARERTSPSGSQHTIEIDGIMGEGFPGTLRLHHRTEFDEVFKQGRRISAGHLLFFVKSNGLAFPRIGIAAGKRYGNAVERNRARRIVREIFRRKIRHTLESVDIVVVVRSKRGRLEFDRCLKDMRYGLKNYVNTASD